MFAQSWRGAQALLNTVQMFEEWSGLRVNQKKTCAMIIGRADCPGQKYTPSPIKGTRSRCYRQSHRSDTWDCGGQLMGTWPKQDGGSWRRRETPEMIEHHPLSPEQVRLYLGVVVCLSHSRPHSHTHRFIDKNTHTHTYPHTYIHTYTHTLAHTHTHTHTHTHIKLLSPSLHDETPSHPLCLFLLSLSPSNPSLLLLLLFPLSP